MEDTFHHGWRDIGGKRKFYRSRWEANYARYLEFLKLHGHIREWEHEPETFYFPGLKRGKNNYKRDFRVTRNDGGREYHEVKGRMDQRSRTVIARFRKHYPGETLRVIDRKRYLGIARSAPIIPDWEWNETTESKKG